MWDLLSSRYANPFAFIEGLMAMNDVSNGLYHIIKDEDEKKLWELYLHSMKEVSFEDWKKQIMQQQNKPLTEAEITTYYKNSLDMLNSLKESGVKA